MANEYHVRVSGADQDDTNRDLLVRISGSAVDLTPGEEDYYKRVAGVPQLAWFSPPLAPSSVDVSIVGSVVRMTWVDNSSVNTDYLIQRSESPSFSVVDEFTVGADDVTWDDTTGSSGVSYYYRIRARRNVSGTFKNSVFVNAATFPIVYPGIPADPTGDTTTVTNDQSIDSVTGFMRVTFSWTDNATNEDDYQVQRSVASGPFSDISGSPFPANTQSINDDNVVADGTTYQYRVRARNAIGNSGWLTGSVVSHTELAAPATLTLSFDVDQTTILRTVAVVSGARDYVYFRRTGGSDPTQSATYFTDRTATTFESSIAGATDQRYRVAVCAADTTGIMGALKQGAVNMDSQPGAPTAFTVSHDSGTLVDGSWTDNSAFESGFRVERKVTSDPDTNYAAISGSPFVAASFDNDDVVVDNESYTYRVRSETGSGTFSAYAVSNSVSVPKLPPVVSIDSLTAVANGPPPTVHQDIDAQIDAGRYCESIKIEVRYCVTPGSGQACAKTAYEESSISPVDTTPNTNDVIVADIKKASGLGFPDCDEVEVRITPYDADGATGTAGTAVTMTVVMDAGGIGPC